MLTLERLSAHSDPMRSHALRENALSLHSLLTHEKRQSVYIRYVIIYLGRFNTQRDSLGWIPSGWEKSLEMTLG